MFHFHKAHILSLIEAKTFKKNGFFCFMFLCLLTCELSHVMQFWLHVSEGKGHVYAIKCGIFGVVVLFAERILSRLQL